ncbi:hypothetical protein BC629DRAFT_413785 [Irpex lacteus]|nr:hypothetical protein BC629DRAFT_413785 [Irpex lacteus]
MQSAAQLDTNRVEIKYLSCLEDMALCAELLESLKPTSVEGEIKDIVADGKKWQVENARYPNRIRTSSQTSIELRTESGPSLFGRAIATRGRSTSIGLSRGRYPSDTGSIIGVTVHGREELTVSERAQNEFVLRILQGTIELTGRLFIELIWFPQGDATLADRPPHPPPLDTETFSELNQSQKEVVAAMLSPSQPIVIAHGRCLTFDHSSYT